MGEPRCKLLFSALLLYSGAIRSHLAAKVGHPVPLHPHLLLSGVSLSPDLGGLSLWSGSDTSYLLSELPTAVGWQKFSVTKGVSKCNPQLLWLCLFPIHLQVNGRHSHKKYYGLMLQNIQRKFSLDNKHSVTQILKVFHIGSQGNWWWCYVQADHLQFSTVNSQKAISKHSMNCSMFTQFLSNKWTQTAYSQTQDRERRQLPNC